MGPWCEGRLFLGYELRQRRECEPGRRRAPRHPSYRGGVSSCPTSVTTPAATCRRRRAQGRYDAHDEPVSSKKQAARSAAYGPGHDATSGSPRRHHLLPRQAPRADRLRRTSRARLRGDDVISRVTGRLGIVVSERVQYLHPDRLGSADTITEPRPGFGEAAGIRPLRRPAQRPVAVHADARGTPSPTGASPAKSRSTTSTLSTWAARVYDYRLGRLLSVDPFVVDPGHAEPQRLQLRP